MARKTGKWRSAFRYLHLWLGLASGLVLTVVGLTGSIYVFQPEISAWMAPPERVLDNPQADRLSDAEMIRKIMSETGEEIESFQWPVRDRQTYMFKLIGDERWHYIDPGTGDITYGTEHFSGDFFGFILDLHTSLTLGEAGRVVTGVASLIFALLMISTGLRLWWPHTKNRLKSSFRIKWNAKPARRNYDLHNVTGMYLAIPLFIVGLTGGYFYFPQLIDPVLKAVLGSTPNEQFPYRPANSANTDGPPLNALQALYVMDTLYPDYYRRNLWIPTEPDGDISLGFQRHITVEPGIDDRIFVSLHPQSGQIIDTTDPRFAAPYERFVSHWLLPLHTGEFGSLATRLLWFLLGLMPGMLFYTGIKIWLKRRKGKTARTEKPKSNRNQLRLQKEPA